MRKKTSGFTLVELLVVIGIIALLISILLPALSKAQAAAKNIKCLSNVRQCVTASLMYAQDNKQAMPPRFRWQFSAASYPFKGSYYTYFPSGGASGGGQGYSCQLGSLVRTVISNDVVVQVKAPYLSNKRTVFCPSTVGITMSADDQLQDEANWPAVVKNSMGNGNAHTGYMFLPYWKYEGGIGKTTTPMVRAWDKVSDVPKNAIVVMDAMMQNENNLSHRDAKNKSATFNVAFIDGHAQSVTSKVAYTQISLRKVAEGSIPAGPGVGGSPDWDFNTWNDSTLVGFDDILNIIEIQAQGRNIYASPAGLSALKLGQNVATNYMKYRTIH